MISRIAVACFLEISAFSAMVGGDLGLGEGFGHGVLG